jgi:hypothetical protein
MMRSVPSSAVVILGLAIGQAAATLSVAGETAVRADIAGPYLDG